MVFHSIWSVIDYRLKTVDYQLENGGLAQLARALALHARGHRFDSDILHNKAMP